MLQRSEEDSKSRIALRESLSLVGTPGIYCKPASTVVNRTCFHCCGHALMA
uniref:Uncharacterized protein n=1 Tax=Arundo donax TaxID=35708 RepID=A0A0A9FCZ3_ARUDO